MITRTILGAVLAASLFGVSQAGAPPQRCGATLPSCPATEYCRQLDGTCAGDGFCETIPASCAPDAAPVCSCGGVSYANECEALAAAESIDTLGPCAADSCAGRICADGEFCDDSACDPFLPQFPFPPVATCREIPTSCPPLDEPVCGCDGLEYPNACEAAALAVSVKFPFPCPDPCAGFSGTPCPDLTENCVLRDGCDSGFDLPGVCIDQPPSCAGEMCVPVCTCSGSSYDNRCLALQDPIGQFETITISDGTGGCDEIRRLSFAGPQTLSWSSRNSALHYNVYRSVRPPQAPPGPWDCLLGQSPVTSSAIVDDPPVGTLWIFGVTAVEADGELGLGISTACDERQIAIGCEP